jgi:flagellar hook-length control protein FliK
MTPVFTCPLVPALSSEPFRPFVQAADFQALLSVSSGPVPEAPAVPVAPDEPISSPPASPNNEAAMIAVPEADIDAAIRPLLTAFFSDPAPISISVVSPATASDEVRVLEIERDEAQPAQPECAGMAIPASVFVPTPMQLPALIASIVAPAMLPNSPIIMKADQSPKVIVPNGGPPVMEPDVDIGVHTQAAPVQTISARQNIARALQQPPQDAALPANQAGVTAITDLVRPLVSTPDESTSVSGGSFQAIITGRLADTSVRPLTDASFIVAERALDVARGSLWLDQLAGDIAAMQDHDRDLSFRLIPTQLGQLDVKIAANDGGLQLNFSTQTDEAARIISQAQSRLVEELKAQGVRVAGSEVNTGSEQSSFAQQNDHSTRADTIAEIDRPATKSSEQTDASEPQNGRFA